MNTHDTFKLKVQILRAQHDQLQMLKDMIATTRWELEQVLDEDPELLHAEVATDDQEWWDEYRFTMYDPPKKSEAVLSKTQDIEGALCMLMEQLTPQQRLERVLAMLDE